MSWRLAGVVVAAVVVGSGVLALLLWRAGGEQESEDRAGVSSVFHSVHFVDEEKGWVGGRLDWEGVILGTQDGGATWRLLYKTKFHISQLHFVDDATGWALGYALVGDHEDVRALLRTSDGGLSWEQRAEFRGPTSADFISKDRLRVLVEDELMETTDGGETWTKLSVPPSEPSRFTQRSFCFNDAARGWITADDAVYGTTDGGRNWALAYELSPDVRGEVTGEPLLASRLRCGEPGVVWASFVEEAVRGRDAMAVTVDNGLTWALSSGEGLVAPVGKNAVSALGCGACNSVYVKKTSDSGATWSDRDDVAPISQIHLAGDMQFIDAKHGWMTGQSTTFPSSHPVILATTDGGLTWEQQYP